MAKMVKQKHGGALKILGKGETSNPNGRPLKVFGQVTKQLQAEGYKRVTKREIEEGFEVLIGLTQAKLLEVSSDEEMPILLRIVSRMLLTKEGFDVAERILDRVHGKAIQQNKNVVDLTLNVEWFDALPEDAQYEIIKKVEEVRQKAGQQPTKFIEDFEPVPQKAKK